MSKANSRGRRWFGRDGKNARANNDAGTDQLRDLLRKKSAELNDESLKKHGEIPAEQLASL